MTLQQNCSQLHNIASDKKIVGSFKEFGLIWNINCGIRNASVLGTDLYNVSKYSI